MTLTVAQIFKVFQTSCEQRNKPLSILSDKEYRKALETAVSSGTLLAQCRHEIEIPTFMRRALCQILHKKTRKKA